MNFFKKLRQLWAEWKHKQRIKKKLKAMQKKDPFIYK